MVENYFGSVDDSLFEFGDKDWMLGFFFLALSIEEKIVRFIQNGYLDIVDGMLELVLDDEYNIFNESSFEEIIKGGEYSYGGQRSVSVALNGSVLVYEEVIYVIEVNNF